MPQIKKATVPSLAEGVRIFKAVSAAKLQTLTDAFDAIDMLERLMIHSSRDPKQRTISYRPAVEALIVIAERRGVMPPDRPQGKVTLRDARDLLGDLRVRLQDRSDPEYWEWRFAQVGMHPGRFALDHLAGMGLIEGTDTQKNAYGLWYTLSRQRARQYVRRVMHEMVAMERLWARRRGVAVDYRAAAQAIDAVVAAAVGRAAIDVRGHWSARRLFRLAKNLKMQLATGGAETPTASSPLQQHLADPAQGPHSEPPTPGQSPSRRRRGRTRTSNPTEDAKLHADYQASGMRTHQEFERERGLPPGSVRQAYDRWRHHGKK